MKAFIITVCGLLSGFITSAQQEPQYTQNQFNSSLMINPAYAGMNECGSVAARYRTQWTGMDGHPATAFITGESRVLPDRLGVGINYYYDRLGIETTHHIDASIAYHLPVNDNGLKFALGFKAGLDAYNANYAKLSNVDPSDPMYGTNTSRTIPAIGIGSMLYNDRFYAGLASPQLINFDNPGIGKKLIEPHFYLYGGMRFQLDEMLELRPALLFKYQQAAPLEADIALNLWYAKTLGLGVAYRTGDAFNFMLQYKYQRITLGYSFDMTVSKLSSFNNGTHEFMIGYEFCRNRDAGMNDRINGIRY